jgi:hypothetical protein
VDRFHARFHPRYKSGLNWAPKAFAEANGRQTRGMHGTAQIVVILLGISAAARAQTASTSQPDLFKIGDVTIQGSIRTRVEVWNWFQGDSGENEYAFSGNIFRISATEATPNWDWQAEFALPFLLGLPSNAVAPGAQGQLGAGATYYVANSNSQNSAMMFPKQAFFRWKNLGDLAGQSLRIGRFELADGAEHTPRNATLATLERDHINQRLIGPFGFTHTGRSFDGFQYTFDRPANNVTIWASTPTRGAYQTDGWGWLHVGFVYAAYTHEWGKGRHSAETRLFNIEYDDWRHVLKVDNRPLAVREQDMANIKIATFGGHSIHAISTNAGTFDLLGWGALQAGSWGSQMQRAWAFAAEAGFQPKILYELKPWLRAGITEGSGSGDPNGHTHGTFFQLLPTPRIYARFPFFNMMNIDDRYGSLVLRPKTKLTISSEFHSLALNNRNDLWYSGGGAYQPWTFGYTGRAANGAGSLANLYDTQADLNLSRALSLTFYCAYAQGLAVMRTIYPRGKNAQFGYTELTYRF